MIKKIIAASASTAIFLTTASPVLANNNCRTIEKRWRGFAYVKTVCRNPDEPVVQRTVVQAPAGLGRATAISIVIVNGQTSISNTAVATANTGGNTQN